MSELKETDVFFRKVGIVVLNRKYPSSEYQIANIKSNPIYSGFIIRFPLRVDYVKKFVGRPQWERVCGPLCRTLLVCMLLIQPPQKSIIKFKKK